MPKSTDFHILRGIGDGMCQKVNNISWRISSSGNTIYKNLPSGSRLWEKNAKGHPVVGYSTLPFTYIDANLCKKKNTQVTSEYKSHLGQTMQKKRNLYSEKYGTLNMIKCGRKTIYFLIESLFLNLFGEKNYRRE